MISDRMRDLVFANPMLIEITRFRRRFFSFSTGNSMNSVILVLALIGYAILVLVVMENATSIAPINLVMFQTGLLMVLAPMMLYGSIAGERERRSWDLLMAAPITKAQVVAGKFIGAMTALGIALIMLLFPILISASSYRGRDTFMYSDLQSHTGWELVTAELVSITFLMVVCALTILFSARVKRGLMALGATLGLLAFFIVAVPAFLVPGNTGGGPTEVGMRDVTMYFHPFYILNRLLELEQGRSADGAHLPPFWGSIQTVVFLILTVITLAWASNTLHFAENEVKFIPKGEKNA